MQREVKRAKSVGTKPKKAGRPNTQPQASDIYEYMQLKQKYKHKQYIIDSRQVRKVPQIQYNIGQLENVNKKFLKNQFEKIIYKIIEVDPSISRQEADAGIQGYKRGFRQKRHYGGYDPNDLIESNVEAQQMINNLLIRQSQQLTQQAETDTNQNINARFNEPSHDVASKIQQSAPDPSIYDSEDERIEKFGGYNRWQEKPLNDYLNQFETNTDQFTDFAPQTDSIQQDIAQEKAQNQQQKQLIQDNKETNKDLQYIGGLDWGQKPVHQWYGKYPNEPHKIVDYNVTDQGALNARQRKVLLSKEELLNMVKSKTHKVATKRIIASVKAQEQLKNKLGRKKK
ncbi:MAG: hypothetical protein EZS28_007843 [Streblomastix strix]|uniref:Uncharacterized protein n=1 Tax=Streblomastix strix TaxID=222440 RepID=A0A5J4WNX4_9EUKA|nr:MAG: hypothetical protein EZS28_007843 [Streblomastix strix]